MSISLPTRAVRRIRPQDMIKRNNVAVTQSLGRLRIVSDDHGILANLGLWKSDSYLHIGYIPSL